MSPPSKFSNTLPEASISQVLWKRARREVLSSGGKEREPSVATPSFPVPGTTSPAKATHQPRTWSKGQSHMLAMSSCSGETSSLCSHWGSVSGVSRAFSVFSFLSLPLLLFFPLCERGKKECLFHYKCRMTPPHLSHLRLTQFALVSSLTVTVRGHQSHLLRRGGGHPSPAL